MIRQKMVSAIAASFKLEMTRRVFATDLQAMLRNSADSRLSEAHDAESPRTSVCPCGSCYSGELSSQISDDEALSGNGESERKDAPDASPFCHNMLLYIHYLKSQTIPRRTAAAIIQNGDDLYSRWWDCATNSHPIKRNHPRLTTA